MCAWADEEKLMEVIARFVVFGDRAQEGKKTAVSVGLPDFLNAVNA